MVNDWFLVTSVMVIVLRAATRQGDRRGHGVASMDLDGALGDGRLRRRQDLPPHVVARSAVNEACSVPAWIMVTL